MDGLDPSMQSFLQEQQQQVMMQEAVSKMTSQCWDKCITSTPGSKFSSSEASCLSNCARRYMDLTLVILKKFQSGH